MTESVSSEITFRHDLLSWFEENQREMPWRETKDPYRIWLSEIMLQQTRVDQALPYFVRFTDAFPTVTALAHADQHDVLMLWEGLGYYSRGRNLHKTAQIIDTNHKGIFPKTYEGLLALPGIGPYTAAAIGSICFSLPRAVVDGNVIRVLSRYYGIRDDVRSSRVKNRIQTHADTLIDHDNPGDFNQAMMELGAVVCKPKNPKCSECPISAHCIAYNTLGTNVIPYKPKKLAVPHHTIVVGIIYSKTGQILIARRKNTVMLGGLWEFPGGKVEHGETLESALIREIREEIGIEIAIIREFMSLRHAYSHFKITLHSYICRMVDGTPKSIDNAEIRWVDIQELADFPFPKANRRITQALMGTS